MTMILILQTDATKNAKLKKGIFVSEKLERFQPVLQNVGMVNISRKKIVMIKILII